VMLPLGQPPSAPYREVAVPDLCISVSGAPSV
jgi:hypothetical protein